MERTQPTRREPVGYKYSSYVNYLGLINQPWVKSDAILEYFSKTNFSNSYKNFVEETDERDFYYTKNLRLEEK